MRSPIFFELSGWGEGYLLDEVFDVVVPDLDCLVLFDEGGGEFWGVSSGLLLAQGLFQKVHYYNKLGDLLG